MGQADAITEVDDTDVPVDQPPVALPAKPAQPAEESGGRLRRLFRRRNR